MLRLKVAVILITVTLAQFCACVENSTARCSLYNKVKQDFMESILPSDYIVEDDDTVLRFVQAGDSEIKGQMLNVDGKIVYESAIKMDFVSALEHCLIRKMDLMAFDTDLETHADSKWRTQSPYLKYLGYVDNFLWTSGAPVITSNWKGELSSSAVYWCSTKTESIFYTNLPPGYNQTEKDCFVYEKNSGELLPKKCSQKFHFFCEFKCNESICPHPSSCKIGKQNFRLTNTSWIVINDPNSYGTWMESSVARAYINVIGNSLVTWHENWKICCSLGLSPMTVDSGSKREFEGMVSKDKHTKLYWSAVTRNGCGGQFSTCLVDDAHKDLPIDFKIAIKRGGGACVAFAWKEGELLAQTVPCAQKNYFACHGAGLLLNDLNDGGQSFVLVRPTDNKAEFYTFHYTKEIDLLRKQFPGKFNLLTRKVFKDLVKLSIQDSRKAIKEFSYLFGIRVDDIEQFMQLWTRKSPTPLKNPCHKPSCYHWKLRKDYRDERLFLAEGPKLSLYKPLYYGNWQEKCGVVFLQAFQTGTWNGAQKFCRVLGMSPLTVQNYDKLNCLTEFLGQNGKDRVFWTAGKKSPWCSSQAEWCSMKFGNFIRDNLIEKLQKGKRVKSCVYFDLNKGTNLNFAYCNQKKPIICEARPRPNMIDIGRECQALARINDKKLAAFSGSTSTYSYAMKVTSENRLNIAVAQNISGHLVVSPMEHISSTGMLKNKNVTDTKGFLDILAEKSEIFKYRQLSHDLLEEAETKSVESTFLLLKEFNERINDCSNISYNANDECSFAYSTLVCMLNESYHLNEFWKKYDDDQPDYTVGVIRKMYSTNVCMQLNSSSSKCIVTEIASNGQIISVHKVWKMELRKAFAFCSSFGASLPVAYNLTHFHQLFNIMEGASHNLLWGEASGTNERLQWCCPNCSQSLDVPLAIPETIKGPFFLVSRPSQVPNLHAVLVPTDETVNKIVCIHPRHIEKCDEQKFASNSEWDRLLNTYSASSN